MVVKIVWKHEEMTMLAFTCLHSCRSRSTNECYMCTVWEKPWETTTSVYSSKVVVVVDNVYISISISICV